MKPETAFLVPGPQPPEPTELEAAERAVLLNAGREVKGCMRALERVGLNLVGEVLKDQGRFIEFEHYPRDDVYDDETHSQYYYHTHRGGNEEHGHFHTFLRAPGMPSRVRPLDHLTASETWPSGNEAICHLIGISMDAWGRPIGLFATNRWVTGETWYSAEAVIGMQERFSVEHAYPSWPVNRWMSAMLKLFRPHIQALLRHRDEVIAVWQQSAPKLDVLEDRNLEVTGYLPVSVDAWIEKLAHTRSGETC